MSSSPSGYTNTLPRIDRAGRPAQGREDSFFWGVATSGYQAEGGYNGPGQPRNNWGWAERDGDVVTSGRTADFWTLAPEDFARCRDMGLNSFRLSIEWSRVQPGVELGSKKGMGEGEEPPPFDEKALHRYAQLIAGCRANGLEPIVTLHHFVQPAWLGLDPWLEQGVIDHFLAFIKKTLGYLLEVLPREFNCEAPRWFITINEPNLFAFNHYLYRIFPSGHIGLNHTVQCLAHLMEAHIRAYRLIHEIYEGTGVVPMVSFNNYCSDLYWSDTAMLDLLFAPSRGVERSRVREDLQMRAHAFDLRFMAARLFPVHGLRYVIGQWLKNFHHTVGVRGFQMTCWDRVTALLYERKEAPLDYIAFDYYDPFIAHALRWPTWRDFESRKRSFRDWMLESVASKWWDWHMLPEGLGFFARHLSRYGLPMLIAENGMALRRLPDHRIFKRSDNIARSQYLREHVQAVGRLVEKGLPLIGYLHWSLFDNYEWGSFSPRFGLFSLDYRVYPTRHSVDGMGDNPSATYTEEIAAVRGRLMMKRRTAEKNAGSKSGATLAVNQSNISSPDSVQKI
jgi:beta-glucosidase/6-phospho-beta-glucosidase/beta-galactosidase